jgi:hypothetical protein
VYKHFRLRHFEKIYFFSYQKLINILLWNKNGCNCKTSIDAESPLQRNCKKLFNGKKKSNERVSTWRVSSQTLNSFFFEIKTRILFWNKNTNSFFIVNSFLLFNSDYFVSSLLNVDGMCRFSFFECLMPLSRKKRKGNRIFAPKIAPFENFKNMRLDNLLISKTKETSEIFSFSENKHFSRKKE